MSAASTRHRALGSLLAFITSLLVGFGSPAASAARQEIEREIKALLADQLKPQQFFVYAIVTEAAAAVSEPGKLPHAGGVGISAGVLRKILESAYPQDLLAGLKVDVRVGFDRGVPETKRKILERMLRERFGFDGGRLVLAVETLDLVEATAKSPDELLALERARMQTEQERLRLSAEQARLDVLRREIEALRKPLPAPPAPVPLLEPKPEDPFAFWKDFQFAGIAIVLGLVILAAIIVGGTFFLRGLKPISEAIGNIGQSIEASADAAVAPTAPAAKPVERAPVVAAAAAPAAVPVTVEAPPDEEFLRAVADKLDVLAFERNFSFVRTFTDLASQEETLASAAAVLMGLKGENAKILVESLSPRNMERLSAFLARPGSLGAARNLRQRALTDFYGRIAVDEFTASPFRELKGLDWLTRMGTAELGAFASTLRKDERPAFLAALSPLRVRKMLEIASADARLVMLSALSQIDGVTRDDLTQMLETVGRRMEGSTGMSRSPEAGPIDPGRFLATIAEELGDAEQRTLFEALGPKKQLVESIRTHFVPFSAVASLPKRQVTELLDGRSDDQVALLVYATRDEVREAILGAFPDIRRESVRDELRALDRDTFYAKRNERGSLALQREFGAVLLKLNADGLLNVSPGQDEKVAPTANVGKEADDKAA